MRQAIALAVVISLVSGLAGAWVFGQLSREAGAAPPPPQAREDQITYWSEPVGGVGTNPQSYLRLTQNELALDATDYPPSSAFRFEVVLFGGAGSTNCIRLFDLTANAAVAGSELCITGGPNSIDARLRSGPLALPSSEHTYTVEGKFDGPNAPGCCTVTVNAARIIAEWTERR